MVQTIAHVNEWSDGDAKDLSELLLEEEEQYHDESPVVEQPQHRTNQPVAEEVAVESLEEDRRNEVLGAQQQEQELL